MVNSIPSREVPRYLSSARLEWSAPPRASLPELEVVLLHLDAAADDLVEDAVGLHELVELPVLADLDHVAHDPLARVALGRFRLDDLVGAVGQRAHAGAGGPGVEGGVVLGR